MTDEAIPTEASAPAPEAPPVAAGPAPEVPGQPGSTPEGGVLPSPQVPPGDPLPVAVNPAAPEATDPPPAEVVAGPDESGVPASTDADNVVETPPAPEQPAPSGVEPPSIKEVRARVVDEDGGVQIPRSDDDVKVGHFATIVDGPYAGRYVVYQSTLESGDDGYPTVVLVKTRDDRDEPIVVNYSQLRPAAPGGR